VSHYLILEVVYTIYCGKFFEALSAVDREFDVCTCSVGKYCRVFSADDDIAAVDAVTEAIL
jgi:hypothetical protein